MQSNVQNSNFPKQGFNSTWTVNFQMFKLDLEKAEEPEIKLPKSAGPQKNQENSRKKTKQNKTIYFCLIDYEKPLTVWITTICGKFLNRCK